MALSITCKLIIGQNTFISFSIIYDHSLLIKISWYDIKASDWVSNSGDRIRIFGLIFTKFWPYRSTQTPKQFKTHADISVSIIYVML